MKYKCYLYLTLGIIIILLHSCTPKIYMSQRVNAPMLRGAGDIQLTSSIKIQNARRATLTALSPSFDFAVSPVSKLGIIGSFRHTNQYINEDDGNVYQRQDSIRYSGNIAELGAGYYTTLSEKGLFEIYGGAGIGYLERNNLKYDRGNYSSQYYNLFLQPAVGFRVRDIFSFCGGLKFNVHKYYHFKTDTSKFIYQFTENVANMESPVFLTVGPFFNFSVGRGIVKFNVQGGTNISIGHPQLNLTSFPYYLTIGLTIALIPRF